MADDITSYRDLIAWQRAFDIGLELYDATSPFPKSEQYGLTSQIRRAAIAIASNIAEGYGRGRTADYLRFLRIARGSIYEVDTQLLFAHKLDLIDRERHVRLLELLNEAARVLAGLIRSIERQMKK